MFERRAVRVVAQGTNRIGRGGNLVIGKAFEVKASRLKGAKPSGIAVWVMSLEACLQYKSLAKWSFYRFRRVVDHDGWRGGRGRAANWP